MSATTDSLDEEIKAAEQHLAALHQRREALVRAASSTAPQQQQQQQQRRRTFGVAALTKDDVERYSRQMLCEDLGPMGTRRLRDATVLVVGAGGLGSTVCLYLAAAGVGKLVIMDFDVVERSNLHRQVIHNDLRTGMFKADSARLSCLALNPHIVVQSVVERLDATNAEKYVSQCNVVVDASDNVASRYLVNDAAVLCGKPLVSGSAMRWEGQLTVYNRSETAPCYRCLFPRPPPAEAVGSCNDTGVVGPVPGMIGCLQALETVKLIAQCGELLCGRMLLWNGLTGMFKVIKLRPRQASCAACGSSDVVVQKDLWKQPQPEYAMVPCLAPSFDLPAENCASSMDLGAAAEATNVAVVDVREKLQHDICHIEGAATLPLRRIASCVNPVDRLNLLIDAVRTNRRKRERTTEDEDGNVCADTPAQLLVVCRRGIASTAAVKLLLEAQAAVKASPLLCEGTRATFASIPIRHVVGGLNGYATQCDPEFPEY